MFTAILLAVLAQNTAINNERTAYLACLKQASDAAKAEKIAADAIEAHLRTKCASIEATFKAQLVAFDVRNKVPRKLAAQDAQLQADDFLGTIASKYRAQLPQ